MNPNAISKRGGKRPGAGRKPNPAKHMRATVDEAERILKSVEYEKEVVNLYQTCNDARLKAQILFRLHEIARGKPVQAIRHEGANDNPVLHSVTVRFVSPSDATIR